MFLYGASGHAKVIIDILQSTGVEISGLFDDNPDLVELNGIKVLGKYNGQTLAEPLIISIGNNNIRKNIAELLQVEFGKAIAASATISPSAQIAAGTVIMQGALVQADARIGAHAIINTGASVDHDCFLDNYVHVSPKASLCGNVHVGEGTHIGAGATVIPNLRIGKWCKIGAGAVVIRDIPDFSTVVGNPARILNKK